MKCKVCKPKYTLTIDGCMMIKVPFISMMFLVLLLASGCEDRGYGTQDINVVPSVISNEDMTLVSSIPKNHGEVAQRSYINLAFSSYLDPQSVEVSQIKLINLSSHEEVKISLEVYRNFLFIKPLHSLKVAQEYRLEVGAMQDVLGNPLSQTAPLTFLCVSDFWESVVAGKHNAIAKSKAGNLYVWGSNSIIPLDITVGEIKVITVDMPMPLPHVQNPLNYSAGTNSIAMVTQQNKLFTLGNNAYSDMNNQDYLKVSAGGNHNLVLKDDGTLYAWGDNSYGQLGVSLLLAGQSKPTQEISKDTNWSDISAGETFTLALKKEGSLWGWGDNRFGQVGQKFDIIPIPLEMNAHNTNITSWQTISAGGKHSLALAEDKSLWAWGDNSSGQLGDGTRTSSRIGTKVINSAKWHDVQAGYNHTLALKDDNTLWAWGDNGSGELGTGNTIDSSTPIAEINTSRRWKSISAGQYYSLGVTNDGRLWAWGTNTNMRLGLGEDVIETDIPLEIK